jgi:lipoprotein NlpI
MLFRFLARARAGETAGPELEANAGRLKTKEWPFAVIELFAGKRTPEATLAAATKPEDVCEAHFYIGEWHLLRGDKAAATKGLRLATDTCPKTFTEFAAAQAELGRLGN